MHFFGCTVCLYGCSKRSRASQVCMLGTWQDLALQSPNSHHACIPYERKQLNKPKRAIISIHSVNIVLRAYKNKEKNTDTTRTHKHRSSHHKIWAILRLEIVKKLINNRYQVISRSYIAVTHTQTRTHTHKDKDIRTQKNAT